MPDATRPCIMCGAAFPVSERERNVVPLARGGSHDLDNMRCAHRYCNSVRGARLMTEAY